MPFSREAIYKLMDAYESCMLVSKFFRDVQGSSLNPPSPNLFLGALAHFTTEIGTA